MEYVNYLKATGENEFIWMKDVNKVEVRFPIKNTVNTVEFDLGKTKRPLLVVGNSNKFKEFIEITLLRNYNPRNIRITEITRQSASGTPLYDLTTNMRKLFTAGSGQTIVSYLTMLNTEWDRILPLGETVNMHNVVILDNILDIAEHNVLIQNLIQDLYDKAQKFSNTTIIFLENNVTDNINAFDFLTSYVGFCFKCDRTSSTTILGTDIAGILSKDDIFYTVIDDEFVKCLIPTFEDNEVDNILDKIIKSR